MKKLIIFIIIVGLFVLGYYYFQQEDISMNNDITQEEQDFNNSGQAKTIEDETDLWKFYSNEEAGVSIKYPYDITLNIRATKIGDLDIPGFGKEEALKDIESLSEGEYGSNFDWPIEVSKKVRNLGTINGQEFMALSRFEVCSVTFERVLVFYSNDHQVQITSKGDKDAIVNSMPEYFKTDEENCQDEKIWDFDKQDEFYQVLSEGKGSEVAQEWFDSFEKVIKTINFGSEKDTVSFLQEN